MCTNALLFSSINRRLYFDLDDRGLRCREKKLFRRRFRSDVRRFVFSNRVVANWNSLSAQCVNSCTVNAFKQHFRVHVRYLLSPVRLSVVCLSVTFVRPTQAVEIFGHIFTALGTMTIR